VGREVELHEITCLPEVVSKRGSAFRVVRLEPHQSGTARPHIREEKRRTETAGEFGKAHAGAAAEDDVRAGVPPISGLRIL
jgi:hypothetical protein